MAEPNYLTAAGAQELAGKIKNYWAERGHQIETRIEEAGTMHGGHIFCVRSSLFKGLPQRTQHQAEAA
jgi:hypothetical protein